MTQQRIQKLLARSGVTSRRKAEDLIRQGRVSVNGKISQVGDKADFDTDAIRVDGKRIRPKLQHHYLLLNKPRGYVTSSSDPEGRRTVFDLVPRKFKTALVCAGRLDYDSEGLLVLTDDGEFVQRLTHPRFGCKKTYAIKVRGIPDEVQLDRLRKGIVIDSRRTAPAEIEFRRLPRKARGEKNSWLNVTLSEGRNRQIREMFFRIGHPVQRLLRSSIGGLADERLPPGALRELTDKEVYMLRSGKSPSTRSRRSATVRKRSASKKGRPPARRRDRDAE